MSGSSRCLVVLWMMVAVAALVPERALGTIKTGPFQLSGSLQAQNIIRHPDVDEYQLIQQRNTARLRFEYDWIQKGQAIGKYRIPFIERSNLFLLYRGVYDSIYDYTPGFIEKEDLHGDTYIGRDLYGYAKLKGNRSGNPGFARRVMTVAGMPHGERDALKFDNQLREAYIDVKLRNLPLTVRAGRQQIVWGESDNFRMLDRVNTLDVTWHFAQELFWDEIRRPFWMFKFLYNLGNIGPFSQNFLEWYWNPGDWQPPKVAFLPRPWGIRIMHPLTNEVDGAFIGGLCELSPTKVKGGPNNGAGLCNSLMNGTKLLQRGNYDRTPMDNSQVGVRYHTVTPQGFEFTLNYMYQRWAGDDGTPSSPVRSLSNTAANRDRAQRLLTRGILPVEYYTPYIHTIGLAGNYSDEEYTQTVFRLETVYDLGIPFLDVAKETVIQPLPVLPGNTKKEMWKGMIAFDRPTWIRALNKKTTFFITGQFFWHHIIDNPSCEPQTVALSSPATKRRVGSCLIGPLDLPSTGRIGTSEDSQAYRDKVRDWELLFSIAVFTFYRGGSVFPFLAVAVDPVNHFAFEVIPRMEYVLRDDLTLTLTQRYFVTPKGHTKPQFDSWGFGSQSRGRSETQINLTWQF